jgi:hypothetical protein
MHMAFVPPSGIAETIMRKPVIAIDKGGRLTIVAPLDNLLRHTD